MDCPLGCTEFELPTDSTTVVDRALRRQKWSSKEYSLAVQ